MSDFHAPLAGMLLTGLILCSAQRSLGVTCAFLNDVLWPAQKANFW